MLMQGFHHLGRALVARCVPVEGDQNALHAMPDKGLQDVIGEPSRPVGARHMVEACRVHRHGVYQRLAQDHLCLAPDAVEIEHPAMWPM